MNSTFREQRIRLPINSVVTQNFIDTKPNYIYFINNSDLPLYVSVSPNVSSTFFDIIVQPYATKKFPRPNGMNEIYLANTDLSNVLNCVMMSFEHEFNPTDLAETQEMVAPRNSGVYTSVEVTNIIGALPIGSNLIGKVDINAELPAGTQNIGSIDINNSPDITTDIPTIYNLVLTTADTEYSQAFVNAKKISISIIDGVITDNFRLAFVTGKVATPITPYLKYPQSVEYWVDKCNIASGTIFLASNYAGVIAQIQIW